MRGIENCHFFTLKSQLLEFHRLLVPSLLIQLQVEWDDFILDLDKNDLGFSPNYYDLELEKLCHFERNGMAFINGMHFQSSKFYLKHDGWTVNICTAVLLMFLTLMTSAS